jgi:serine/threonine protein kinase
MKVTPISCGPAVNESERKAFEQIKTGLISELRDGEWLLLTNLAFSTTHRRQSDEIDIVAIGPPGIRVIEIKHWNATWVNRNAELVERAAERVTDKARKVGTTLRRMISELDRVDGVFLVTQDTAKVKPLEGREVRGVRFHTLRTWQGALALDAPVSLSPSQVKMLGKALYSKASVAIDGALRRLAGYVNLTLQTPADERFHRIYRGTHSTRRDSVLLHLYDVSATEQRDPEARARREFDALHRLQLHAWAPRIVDSFQEAPGYAGEMWFFTVADPVVPSVEQRADDTWDTKARLAFARQAVEALMELHEVGEGEKPMLHRNLTPGTILVKHDNTPILTGFQYARIPDDVTVAVSGGTEDEWDVAVAPEIRKQGFRAADRQSDVYSLCASLSVLFAERDDDESLEASVALAEGSADDPTERTTLEKLRDSLSDLLGEPPVVVAPPARFWTEDQIVKFRDRDYRIVSRLGSGGVGTTFKVVRIDGETGGDLGAYVAKVVSDEEIGRRVLQAYNLAHSHLADSAALSTIFETAEKWSDNDFVALMQWIAGEPLSELAGVLPILAEDFHEESGEALALRWLRTVCDALDVLHRNGLVHGDVSPRNLIVADSEIVLMDYDCVAKVGDPVIPGTVMYSPHTHLKDRPAVPSDDFFALAASFFQVLFEKEPFMYDGSRIKERGLNWEGVEREEYPTVAAFLAKATNPDPDQRFASAAEAKAVLNPPRRTDADEPVDEGDVDAIEPKLEPLIRSENEVPWLRSLLQSYPGSRWGNSETRGLDTDFAEQTYVETKLEEALYHDILRRKVRLVILCGNAGDGKTALLQHLAGRFGFGVHNSSERILESQMDDGLIVRMNLDGSASWQGRSADELLDEFLEPFQKGSPDEDIVHLLAINDGRLLEWIDRVESETPLTQALYDLLNGEESALESHIRFISLNQRSLVGSVVPSEANIKTGFLEDLLDSLYGKEKAPQIWVPCETCSAQDRCEVRRAMRRFGPKGLPGMAPQEERDRARQRLFEMLQAVHLRGETHITVRELRATLVYILFGVHFCSDYHGVADAPLPYWDRAFSPESPGRQGEVLQELIRFDPALEAHPQIDRHLLRTPSVDTSGGTPHYPELTLEEARRRAYFEWTEDNIAALAVDPHALGLAQARHYREFSNLPIAEGDLDDICRRLCEGIARLESLPPQAFDRSDVVSLRITPRTPTETAFWVEKPLSNFRLEADLPAEAEGLDRLHRQAFLIYRYRDGREERLRLGSDLFHLLLELSEGYQLGDVSTDDTFAHLSIFVQRLVREDDRTVLAWNPMQDEAIYEVSAQIVKGAGTSVQQQMVIQRLGE